MNIYDQRLVKIAAALSAGGILLATRETSDSLLKKCQRVDCETELRSFGLSNYLQREGVFSGPFTPVDKSGWPLDYQENDRRNVLNASGAMDEFVTYVRWHQTVASIKAAV